MKQVTVTINGKTVKTSPRSTILMAARSAGFRIPTLCYHPRLSPVGSCRLCVVEVQGRGNLAASCVTPVADGMVVRTDSERVIAARRLVVELLLAGGEHNCSLCAASGDCELQNLAYELGIEKLDFPVEIPGYPKDTSNAMIERDLNKCVLCGRCVRACNDVQVNEVIDIGFRGARAKIVTAFDASYGDSDCVFCGECVSVCPTGALREKAARFRGRPWEFQKTRTTCVYCGTGCQLDLNVRDGRLVKVTSDFRHGPPNYGSLCAKGRFANDFVHHPDRLTVPLIKEDDEFREATWDEAMDLVVLGLSAIQTQEGPDAIGVLASARCTNEENYLLQKFTRACLGTNNIDHCARL